MLKEILRNFLKFLGVVWDIIFGSLIFVFSWSDLLINYLDNQHDVHVYKLKIDLVYSSHSVKWIPNLWELRQAEIGKVR